MQNRYIEENIEELRKQRDTDVVGGYRDLVVKTYNYIEKKINQSEKGYCNPRNKDICKAVFGHKKAEEKIRGFVKDLKISEYISTEDVGVDRKVRILKKIDF